MAKRFTDTGKWRNEWFRNLPLKAKLVWIYLCDECEFYGVWKADFGLASFQLAFTIEAQDLVTWFGNKVYFFDTDKVLIVPFFEFQYGDSKESWTAKIKARQRLQTLGFHFDNNRVLVPQSHHSHTTVGGLSNDHLIVSVGEGVGEVEGKGESEGKITQADLESLYELYPNKVGKSEGLERLAEQNLSHTDFVNFTLAISNYKRYLELEKNKGWLKAKQWDVFVGPKTKKRKPWHDWINPDPSIFDDHQKPAKREFDPMTAPLRGT